jgi:hypothetical protein
VLISFLFFRGFLLNSQGLGPKLTAGCCILVEMPMSEEDSRLTPPNNSSLCIAPTRP